VKLSYSYVVILLCFFSVLGAHGFGRFSFPVLLEDMRASLGVGYSSMGVVEFGSFLGYLVMAASSGFLASRVGHRAVMGISGLLMGLSMILTAWVRSVPQLLALRLLTGLGNGGLYLLAITLPSVWLPANVRGVGTGVVSAGIGMGFTLSGLLLPVILAGQGWRAAWLYMGVALIYIALADFILVRNPPKPGRARRGMLSLVNSRILWVIGLVYMAYGLSYIIYLTYLFSYLITGLGLSRIEAGGLYSMIGVLSILSGILWGYLSDRIGRVKAMSLAYSSLATSYALVGLLTGVTPSVASALIFALSAWSIPTIAIVTAGEAVDVELRAAAGSFVTLFFGIGQAIGTPLGGYIIDVAGFQTSFTAAALIAVSGAAAAHLIKTPRNAASR